MTNPLQLHYDYMPPLSRARSAAIPYNSKYIALDRATSANIASNKYNLKTKKVKIQLKIGSYVEIYSESKDKWLIGTIVKMKKKLICVKYAKEANKSRMKWLEISSKDWKPKLDPATNNNNNEHKLKIINKESFSTNDDNEKKAFELNNPSAYRIRKSIALQQKKQVSVKLHLGSLIEVFDASSNQWIDAKLTKIKDDLVCVAYGEDFNAKKWLKHNSKQVRPKLDLLDAVFDTTSDEKACNLYSVDEDTNDAYLAYKVQSEQYQQNPNKLIETQKDKRWDLKVEIHEAVQLKHDANYATITLAGNTLETKRVATNANPIWNFKCRVADFKPQIGKTAVVIVWNKNIVMEKQIGKAEFELAVEYDTEENMTLEIADHKNQLSGVVLLKQIIVNHMQNK